VESWCTSSGDITAGTGFGVSLTVFWIIDAGVGVEDPLAALSTGETPEVADDESGVWGLEVFVVSALRELLKLQIFSPPFDSPGLELVTVTGSAAFEGLTLEPAMGCSGTGGSVASPG
jgi:hypothetical protein